MTEPTYPVTVFKYERPTEPVKLKQFVRLARTDIQSANIQVIGEGGENNLHSHSALDGIWFVLGGRARFYGTDDKLLGDLGKFEGLMIPRNTPYWFESAGDEVLEILQVEAIAQDVKNERINLTPLKASFVPPEAMPANSY